MPVAMALAIDIQKFDMQGFDKPLGFTTNLILFRLSQLEL